MTRITTPPSHRFPWYVRLFLWNQRRRYGAVLEPARLWGRSPRVFAALALLFGTLDRRGSPLSPALRALLTVRVSQLNWCTFCVDINGARVLRHGVSDSKLVDLPGYRDSPYYDAAERAALDYAEAITCSDRQVDDALFATLREYFEEEAIIELTAMIAFQNMSSKFNAALNVAPQGFCRLPATRESNEASPAARLDR
ncbi:MAG: carboxymuconolactone decarboxylase family protein [Gammaproteobacteria bacterium]|jgi:AhpD family alkylhydroperoxidase|nr:carboxymuconolactone decarboxylase family protein [Gammaproteobacteria bacterium]